MSARRVLLLAGLEGRLVNQWLGLQDHAELVEMAEVALVADHAVDDGVRDLAASGSDDPALVHEGHAVLDAGALGVHPEHLLDDRSLHRIENDVPVLVGLVANRQRCASVQSLFCCLTLAAHDLLAKLCGVILRDTFQDRFQHDPLRAFRNGLGCVEQADSGLLESELAERDVLPVTAEAVDLPDDHDVKAALLRVVEHLLKLHAIVCGLSRDVSVRIYPYDVNAIFGRILAAVCDLALDGLVGLSRAL